MPAQINNNLLSVGKAANLLKVSPKTLRRWDKKGILSSQRTQGGQRRYRYKAISDFINKRVSDKSQQPLLSVGKAANLLKVSPKTLRRWDKKGILSSQRTQGGQRRYRYKAISDFIKDKGSVRIDTIKQPWVQKEQSFIPQIQEHILPQPSPEPKTIISPPELKHLNLFQIVSSFIFVFLFLLISSVLAVIFTPYDFGLKNRVFKQLADLISPLLPEESQTSLLETEQGIQEDLDMGKLEQLHQQPITINHQPVSQQGGPIFSSDFLPSLTNTYSIGSSLYEWKDLYLGGTAYIKNNLTVLNNIKVGGVDSDLIPKDDGIRSLGSTDKEWNDLYIDGQAHIDSLDMDGDIYMDDDKYIGLGKDKARIEFDDLVSDEINFLDAKVGIGTTTPNYTLHVSGTGYFSSDVSIGGSLTVSGTTTFSGHLLPGINDTYDIGSNVLRWRNLYLGAETIHIGTSITDEATILYNTSSNDIQIDNSYGDVILQSSSGSVGIGTTTPGEALDVSDNISLGSSSGTDDDYLYFDQENEYLFWDDDAGKFVLSDDLVPETGETHNLGDTGTTWNSLYLGDDTGIYLGNNQDFHLYYEETTNDRLELSDGTNVFLYIDDEGTSADFAFNTDDLFISDSGSVGIGTTTPGEKLTLAGGNFLHSASSNPTLEGTYETSGDPWDVYVSGKYAYVADGIGFGLQIIDISNPALPTLTGTYGVSHTYGVHVSGKYAYTANSNFGMHIIDISNPSSPSLIATYDTSGAAYGIYVSGKYAYVADGTSGLQIIDISNPSSLSLTGTYNTSGAAYGIYVSGKYAYIADNTFGLQIIDISNPSSPSFVGTYDTSGNAWGIYVSGKYAYVADGPSGLQIIDISNPSLPSFVGTYDTFWARGVNVSGKYAYVADDTSGLRIIDISNPALPSLIGTYDTGNAYGIYVSGKYAYIADYTSGLQIIDINGIETPSLHAGNIQTNAMTVTENLDIGNNLYVRNGLNVGPGGLYVDAGEVAFDSNSGATAFRFGQSGTGDILNVFDETTEVFTILNGGYVGIGMTNPGAQLDLSTDSARKLTTTTWATGSDAKIKTNVQSIDNALDIIRQTRPVKYHFTQDFLSANPSVNDIDYYHFIAQEYQQVFPDSVTETDGLLYLNSSNMIPYAIAGIKALDQGIQEQQSQITNLFLGLDELGNLIQSETVSNAAGVHLNVVDTKVEGLKASMSAAQISINTLTSQTNSLISQTDSLTSRIDFLETMVLSISEESSTSAAQTSQHLVLGDVEDYLELDQNLVLQQDLNVLGETIVNDLGVTGKITSGLLVIDGLNTDNTDNALKDTDNTDIAGASIYTLSGPLKLQETGLGGIEMMGGKIEIAKTGSLHIKEGVVYGNDNMRQKEIIPSGEGELRVDKTWDKIPTTINVTPAWDTNTWVEDVSETGFTIKFNNPPEEEKEIYWVALW